MHNIIGNIDSDRGVRFRVGGRLGGPLGVCDAKLATIPAISCSFPPALLVVMKIYIN